MREGRIFVHMATFSTTATIKSRSGNLAMFPVEIKRSLDQKGKVGKNTAVFVWR
jgi:hypothetical protein